MSTCASSRDVPRETLLHSMTKKQPDEPERRQVRGWRGRLEDLTSTTRARVAQASAVTVHDAAGETSPDPNNLLDHGRWFRRVFSFERAEASEDIRNLALLRQRLRTAERTPEQIEIDRQRSRERYRNRTPEQIEARRAYDRTRLAARTPEEIERYRLKWHERQARKTALEAAAARAKKRAERAARTDAERERNREWWRQWRAAKPAEWHAKQVAQARRRREANAERYYATKKAYGDRFRIEINEARRRRRAAKRITKPT